MNARLSAPELPHGLEWVNAREAPRLGALRGRVVLLNFWTASNVNSQHVLPDLRYLENKYHDGLSVIGIHCPKFTEERNAGTVLKLVNRGHIRHAVASDPHFHAWQLYGVRAWPTLALIDTEGRLVGMYAGEGRRAELDTLIGEILDEAATRDARVYESAPPVLRPEPKLPLRFPAKILATDSMLYVADSGHNRILECAHDGRVLRQFGSGNPGFWDGRGTDAGFANPQGMALLKDTLYVADHDNHAIRRVRLLTGEVDTVAGTGSQSLAVVSDAPDPRTIPLNSPLDIATGGERLYIALAGQHQIWVYDLARQRLGVFAGSGKMGLSDGAPTMASFAKPSGLTTHAQMLYVADADASAVRSVRLLDGYVKTLVGTELYEFGDVDGLPVQARLQHPGALAVDPGGTILWVADTYNNKVKAMSMRGGGVRTLALPFRFHGPCGISVAARSLWIANTNAHEVIRIDTGTGAVKRLPIGE
jgi:thiol-disulfide isomerase/thioredoxin